MSLSTPTPAGAARLTKYELLSELGHGGMATVWRARDVRLGREVAVKIIHRWLRENPEMDARFVTEARAVAKLRHPNIVEVYDVSDEDDPERFLVVELLRGTTLRRWLAEHPGMPPEIGAALALEVGAALAHAHAHGVVHRDVKPENVLLDRGGDGRPPAVKLTDFGIAKILDAQGVTSTGQVLGSPAHMAPEQIEGHEVDARADVFSLGVLFYECVVGHLPFEGKNPAQVLRRVLEGAYPPADREQPTVGARWARILDRALAREVAARWPTVAAMNDAVRAELRALGADDPHAELAAYFADPAAWSAALPARLVPVLARRAEAARRTNDRVGAAADLNRALAYAPSDAALLRALAGLGRRASQRRAALVLAGAGVVAAAVPAAIRALRAPAPAEEPAPAPPPPAPAERASADAPPAPPIATASVPSPAPSHAVSPIRPPVLVLGPSTHAAEPAPRAVSFQLSPKGAQVSVDGGPLEDVFGRTKVLAPGAHAIVARVLRSSCCDELATTVHVRAAAPGDEEPQVVRLSLRFRDARLRTVSAPLGARVRCPSLGIDGAASAVQAVRMSQLELSGSCDLEAPGVPTVTTSITLRAGESATIPWPSR